MKRQVNTQIDQSELLLKRLNDGTKEMLAS